MFCILLLSDAILFYIMLAIAILTAMVLIGHLRDRTHNFKISRLTLRKCKNCGLIFAASRFNRQRHLSCPRCSTINTYENKEQFRK